MAIKIGVVCEGSHDFNVISIFVRRMFIDQQLAAPSLTCLQPEVSSTFQTTNGGWGRVKGWCARGGGSHFRKYLDQPLLANSPTYDLIIIHLDGDVVDFDVSHPFSDYCLDDMSIGEVVDLASRAILECWLKLDDEHESLVVPCVPVRHLEAWLIGGIDPSVSDIEKRSTKGEFKAGIGRRLRGPLRSKYIHAAEEAASNRSTMLRSSCLSYRAFENGLLASATSLTPAP